MFKQVKKCLLALLDSAPVDCRQLSVHFFWNLILKSLKKIGQPCYMSRSALYVTNLTGKTMQG